MASTDPSADSLQTDDGVHSAFFYGTLMVPEIFFTVVYGAAKVADEIARQYTFRPAILHGYCRRRILHADYPGITEDPAHQVFGTYATGLTRANMAKLDYFEGSQYVRKTVRVRLLDRVGDEKGVGNVEGEECAAQVYVFADTKELEDREWDLEEFRRGKLQKWTRQGFVFADCDPNRPAAVVEDGA